jgi:serine/threonine protein kinase
VLQEETLLKRLMHPNVASLFETFEQDGKRIIFVIELCAGGDLLNYVRKR